MLQRGPPNLHAELFESERSRAEPSTSARSLRKQCRASAHFSSQVPYKCACNLSAIAPLPPLPLEGSWPTAWQSGRVLRKKSDTHREQGPLPSCRDAPSTAHRANLPAGGSRDAVPARPYLSAVSLTDLQDATQPNFTWLCTSYMRISSHQRSGGFSQTSPSVPRATPDQSAGHCHRRRTRGCGRPRTGAGCRLMARAGR